MPHYRSGLAILYLRVRRYVTDFPAALDRELSAGAGLNWLFALFAMGIASCLALPRDPDPVALGAGFCLCAALALRAHFCGRRRTVQVALAAFLAGAVVAGLRAETVRPPVFSGYGARDLAGEVGAIRHTASGPYILLENAQVDGVTHDGLTLRLRPRGGPALDSFSGKMRVGDFVAMRGFLPPPRGPALPGGYDFRRADYFAGIAASGFAFGTIRIEPRSVHSADRFIARQINAVRRTIASRIVNTLGGNDASALVVALLTGQRGLLEPAAVDALRISGLAHILAISGLHMALFGGLVFGSVRAGLALIPGLALRWRIDRAACLAGCVACALYFLISGASLATQRAFIMIFLLFLARLCGRPALTIRNVSLAGIIILVLQPEALLNAGFQMSFAATFALVAIWRGFRDRRTQSRGGALQPGLPYRKSLARHVVLWASGLFVTSLIAGLATTPIAALHFERVAPLGLLTNVMAMPLFSLAVMPLGIVALLAMPFGLEFIALVPMGWCTQKILDMAGFVAVLTPHSGLIGAQSPLATCALASAAAMLVLMPRYYRRLALVPFAIAGLALAVFELPDLYIAENGKSLAFHNHAGQLRIVARRSSFAARAWLRAGGIDAAQFGARRATRDDGLWCDEAACIVEAWRRGEGDGDAPAPLLVSLVREPSAFVEDCAKADIVISALRAPQNCRPRLLLDRTALARHGAAALFFRLTRGQNWSITAEFANDAMRRWVIGPSHQGQ